MILSAVYYSMEIGKCYIETSFFLQEINEHYLFHGTKPDIVDKIIHEGLDSRLTNKAMLGRGVYCAEDPTKSDQYAGNEKKIYNNNDKRALYGYVKCNCL